MAIVESGPIRAIHEVIRGRLVDLCRRVSEEFRVVISTQTMSRELRAMNCYKSPAILNRQDLVFEGLASAAGLLTKTLDPALPS
jgi:hypothetical protein